MPFPPSVKLERRVFLKGSAIAVGITAASPWADYLLPVVPSSSVLIEPRGSGLFLAEASPIDWVWRVMGGAASIATILDWLDIKVPFRLRPSYHAAGGCTGNCQAEEEKMRRDGMNVFSDVGRAPDDHDLAVMAGAKVVGQAGESSHGKVVEQAPRGKVVGQSPELLRGKVVEQGRERLQVADAEAALQYEGADAISLRGREAEAVAVAADYFGRNWRMLGKMSGRELARNIGVTAVNRGVPVTHPVTGQRTVGTWMTTASGGRILDAPKYGQYSEGIVALYPPGKSPVAIRLVHG